MKVFLRQLKNIKPVNKVNSFDNVTGDNEITKYKVLYSSSPTKDTDLYISITQRALNR